MEFDFDTLKARQRAIRHTFPEGLGLRVHRALSWFQRAEMEDGDHDARFTFLWIAFNAAYAHELPDRASQTEKDLFLKFLQKLIDLDKQDRLYGLLWTKFSSSVRLILENPYVYQPFWDFHAGLANGEDWEERFRKSRLAAQQAIASKDTLKVLRLVLDRLYVLRNQLVHGGATWNSKVNREQMRDGARFMADLVPLVIHLMMENPDELWGAPSYPVVESVA